MGFDLKHGSAQEELISFNKSRACFLVVYELINTLLSPCTWSSKWVHNQWWACFTVVHGLQLVSWALRAHGSNSISLQSITSCFVVLFVWASFSRADGCNEMSSQSIVSLLHRVVHELVAVHMALYKLSSIHFNTNHEPHLVHGLRVHKPLYKMRWFDRELASSCSISLLAWALLPCTWLEYNELTINDELASPCTWRCTRRGQLIMYEMSLRHHCL